MALSCAKELADTNQEATDIKYKTITFEAVSDNTKTSIEETTDGQGNRIGIVKWDEGDKISLYYWDGEQQVKVDATADNEGTTTTFTAKIDENHNPEFFYATYPADKGTLTVVDGVPSFKINVNGSACDGSFKQANFAAAYTTGRTLQFHNAVGMMRVALPKDAKVVRGRDGAEYPITGIYVRCKSTSVKLNGELEFYPEAAENEEMFSVAKGDANVSMQKLSAEVLASGYVYIPCTPATWPDGVCFRYYSSAGAVPAVLTKEKEVKVQRGHIFPVPDISSKVVWDYYVASDASEDGAGLSVDDPMTLAKLQSEYLDPVSKQYGSMRMNSTTINFAPGTYNLANTLKFPQGATAGVTYSIEVNGNGAILDGGTASTGAGDTKLTVSNQGKQVMSIGQYSHIVFNNLIIQNGYASSGAGVAVNYDSGAKDDNTTASFNNCQFLKNVSSSSGAAVFIDEDATGGVLTFNNCYFKDNQTNSNSGAAVYTNKAVTAIMFNKCTFYKNKAAKGGHDIHVNNAACRLALNNCTFNGFNPGTGTTQGSLITSKGYCVIANSTVWNSKFNGNWGSISLGCATTNNKVNGSAVINSVVRNAETQNAFYVSKNYYQNYRYCIYTGLGVNDNEVALNTHYFIDSCYDLGVDGTVNGAGGTASTYNGIPNYYYTWSWVEGYPCPNLMQVRDAIFNVAEIGPMFLRWLDTIEGSLTTDINGQPRNENAICPGSYQQATTPSSSTDAASETQLKVMSFNILREDLGGSDHKWSTRKEAVLQMLSNHYPALIGLQECSWTIRKNILEADPRRAAIGVSVFGNESGYTDESSNSIIYRTDLLEAVTSGTFWFSDTPGQVSNVWTERYEPKPRVCTWARFRSKQTGQEFYHFNLHLHNGSANNPLSNEYIGDSRTKSLNLLFEKIAEYNTDKLPVIITGDHNEGDHSSNALSDLGSDVAKAYVGSGYTSVRWTAAETDKDRTLNSFNEEQQGVMDHIYINSGCVARKFSVDREAYAGVTYISDHYPVICELSIKAKNNSMDIEDYDYGKVNW